MAMLTTYQHMYQTHMSLTKHFKSLFGTCQGRSPSTQIILFDQPGYQTQVLAGTLSMSLSSTQPLIPAYGQNRFDEFCINFTYEMLQSYVLQHDDELPKDLMSKFTVHASFVAECNLFGINQWQPLCGICILLCCPFHWEGFRFVQFSIHLFTLQFFGWMFLNFSLDLVWLRRDIARTIRLLFKLKFHLDLYVTLHLSFLPTTLYIQCRMNILTWILARCILSPPNSISLFLKSSLLLNVLN